MLSGPHFLRKTGAHFFGKCSERRDHCPHVPSPIDGYSFLDPIRYGRKVSMPWPINRKLGSRKRNAFQEFWHLAPAQRGGKPVGCVGRVVVALRRARAKRDIIDAERLEARRRFIGRSQPCLERCDVSLDVAM